MHSSFEVIFASTVLYRGMHDAQLLAQNSILGQSDMATYFSIAKKHVRTGIRIEELCASTPKPAKAIKAMPNATRLLMRTIGTNSSLIKKKSPAP